MEITKKTGAVGGLTAVIATIGATAMLNTSEIVEVGESKIVNQTQLQEIIVKKTSEENKEIQVFKRQYDQKTGQEVNPAVFTFNTDTIHSDIIGKQNDIAMVEARKAELTEMAQGASGTIVTVTTPQFNVSTGEQLAPLVQEIEIEKIEDELKSLDQTVVALNLQIDELNLLLEEAEKVK